MDKIYLDYAASTPVDPEVLKSISPYFGEKFGNPGSLHSFGREAMAAIDDAREVVAGILGAKFHEVIFTGSATEANNLAMRGVISKLMAKRVKGSVPQPPYRVITTSIEHESVRDTVLDLNGETVEVVQLPVSKDGVVDLASLAKALNPRTVLVSIIYGSNVVGAVQPIEKVAETVRAYRKEIKSPYPLFHTDAAQAFQFLDMDVATLGVDMLTISGQKFYAPKGCGVLYLKEDSVRYVSGIITGGSQEFGLRAATENVPAIVGLAKAANLVCQNKEAESRRIAALRDRLWTGLTRSHPELELNGPDLSSGRLPNNLHIYFPGHDVDELLVKFDLAGVAVSAGSACTMRSNRSSYVLRALGFGEERSGASLRFSLGRPTTEDQIDAAVGRIIKLL
ncbi:MAG: cysteine desulfurase [Patescibacteria group bacterium]|nr:cysteine desulfurase [Patescibacteria group bacterium]MCL5224346.1 cysteine desulfurase [Patescibacteria group bacterium]